MARLLSCPYTNMVIDYVYNGQFVQQYVIAIAGWGDAEMSCGNCRGNIKTFNSYSYE